MDKNAANKQMILLDHLRMHHCKDRKQNSILTRQPIPFDDILNLKVNKTAFFVNVITLNDEVVHYFKYLLFDVQIDTLRWCLLFIYPDEKSIKAK